VSPSPADNLLSALLRPDRAGAPLPQGLPGTDWDLLLDAADRHGVAALLHHRLKGAGGDRVPAPALDRLRKKTLENAGTNLKIYRELGFLAGRLREGGVEAIALKGAHLASGVYGNIALRGMADLDLLVRKGDLPRAAELMAGMGYSPANGELVRLYQHLPPFVRPGFPLFVEIHFTIADPPFLIPAEELFGRAVRRTLEGVEVLTLCPEDLLLHLCVHDAVHHGFCNGLKGLLDVAFALERFGERLSWRELVERGREWGLKRALFLELSLARELAGARVPEQILGELGAHPGSAGALSLAREMLFAAGEAGGPPLPPNLARLSGKRGVSRLAFLLTSAFVPRAWTPGADMKTGSPWVGWFPSLFRIAGLFRRHRKALWSLFRGDPETLAAAAVEERRNRLRDWQAGR